MPATLNGRRVALVVNDGGWRNTTAFQLGVSVLGGVCVAAPIRLDGAEAVPDLAAYLDNWVDAAIIRAPDISLLRSFAEGTVHTVINSANTNGKPSCRERGCR